MMEVGCRRQQAGMWGYEGRKDKMGTGMGVLVTR